jgi:hypothetical protein
MSEIIALRVLRPVVPGCLERRIVTMFCNGCLREAFVMISGPWSPPWFLNHCILGGGALCFCVFVIVGVGVIWRSKSKLFRHMALSRISHYLCTFSEIGAWRAATKMCFVVVLCESHAALVIDIGWQCMCG